MSSKAHDINQPILIVVRRGRGGRGYTVAPVDSPTDIAACSDAEQVGEAIIEMLDDDKQPRVDIDALLRAADGDFEEAEEEERGQGEKETGEQDLDESDEDDEDDVDEADDEEEEQPWYKAKDPADALLITGLSKLLQKGREVSRGSRRRGRGRRGRKGKRT